MKPPRSLAARGLPALAGEFWGKTLAAAGTPCPGDLPSKFSEAAPAAPALGSGRKESTFGSRRAAYGRVSGSGVYSRELDSFPFGAFCFVLFLRRLGLFLWNKPICFVLEWGVPCWREERVVGL